MSVRYCKGKFEIGYKLWDLNLIWKFWTRFLTNVSESYGLLF